MNWSEQSEIFETILQQWLAKEGIKYSHQAAAEYLGTTRAKYSAWVKNGQRPVADDMRMLAQEFEFSANWLLLGVGNPLERRKNEPFDKKYVQICDTLHEVIYGLGKKLPEIASTGGITTTELYDCIHTQAFPPIMALARWVIAYKINANFVLAQIGQPYLTDEEWHEQGPLDRIRDRRGDFLELERETDDDNEFNDDQVPPDALETPAQENVNATRSATDRGNTAATSDENIAEGFDAQRKYLDAVCAQLRAANAPDSLIQEAIMCLVMGGSIQPIQKAAGV